MRRTESTAICVMVVMALTACAPAPVIDVTEAPPVTDGGRPVGQQQAFFAAYPQTLLTAAVAACSDPGQRPVEPGPGQVRCESLPTPDAAAALILSYGGTVEALPLYIVTFDAVASQGGYLVTADNYVTIPQTDGTLREVRLADQRVDIGMMELFVAAGGQPVAPN